MKRRRQVKQKKKITQAFKQVSFPFWNNNKQYKCIVTSPINIENYRLKEVFDNTFVCKKEDTTKILNAFASLDEKICYEII